jgi:uncharacterized membrane protein YoaK (UPF0700 family)
MPHRDPADRPFAGLVSDARHGPLPGLLLLLTATTGIIDAVSILSLGRVFVANMTGNVVFVGFALVGAKGFGLAASLFALGGFLVGASAGGSALARIGGDRGVVLRNTATAELALLVVVLIVVAPAGSHVHGPRADVAAALLAVALGARNSTVRRLAVPDLTTTVLTMTLTGIASDLRTQGRGAAVRRVLAVATMLAGAVAGALLDLHVGAAAALGAAIALMVTVLTSTVLAPRTGPWRAWPGH